MAKLSGLRLPDDSRFLRKIPPSKRDDADFVERFDRHTLFYDVFHDPEAGTIRIVAPSLVTQKRLVRQMTLKVDGHLIDAPEVNFVSPRTSEIMFDCPVPAPETLRVKHRGAPRLNAQVRINPANLAKFEGRNALVTISKNNRLEWIRDWLLYHVTQQGANAIVLIDNGSDAYSLRDLRRTILSVKGIEAAEILSAPYPFGPKGVDRVTFRSKFLHLSALHIAHHRFLKKANAVLSVDIDELVTKPGEQTVFEAVKDTANGYLTIRGTWRYAKKPNGDGVASRHADHVLKRIEKDEILQPKWCVDPQGQLAGRYWGVHGILPGKRKFAHGFEYLHCRQVTTNWDYDRDFEPEDMFEPAPEADLLRAVFGDDG